MAQMAQAALFDVNADYKVNADVLAARHHATLAREASARAFIRLGVNDPQSKVIASAVVSIAAALAKLEEYQT